MLKNSQNKITTNFLVSLSIKLEQSLYACITFHNIYETLKICLKVLLRDFLCITLVVQI